MKATEEYYLNKIAKLEKQIADIKYVFEAFYKLGLSYIPVDSLREAVMGDGETK